MVSGDLVALVEEAHVLRRADVGSRLFAYDVLDSLQVARVVVLLL